MRLSSPPATSERPSWSSQMLTPASVSAFSFGFTSARVLISVLSVRLCALYDVARRLCDTLRGKAEVLEDVLGDARGAEAVHTDRLSEIAHPAMPAEGRGRLDRDAGPYVRR